MPFTNCQKKEGSHPLSVRRICPFTEEAIEGLRGVHLLVVAVTTKRLLGSATQEKAEVPPSACIRRIHPFTDDALLCSPRYKPAAIGRTAHQRLLMRTTTTPLLRPKTSQGNTSNKTLWSSPCLRCSLVHWRQSSQRFSTGTTDEDTFPSVHLGHKKDLGSRAPGPLFLQPPHTPSSWKNDPTREQIRRFRRAHKRRG